MGNAAGHCDPSSTESWFSQFPPSAQQIIDQFGGFLAIPFLELARRGEYSFPVEAVQSEDACTRTIIFGLMG